MLRSHYGPFIFDSGEKLGGMV